MRVGYPKGVQRHPSHVPPCVGGFHTHLGRDHPGCRVPRHARSCRREHRRLQRARLHHRAHRPRIRRVHLRRRHRGDPAVGIIPERGGRVHPRVPVPGRGPVAVQHRSTHAAVHVVQVQRQRAVRLPPPPQDVPGRGRVAFPPSRVLHPRQRPRPRVAQRRLLPHRVHHRFQPPRPVVPVLRHVAVPVRRVQHPPVPPEAHPRPIRVHAVVLAVGRVPGHVGEVAGRRGVVPDALPVGALKPEPQPHSTFGDVHPVTLVVQALKAGKLPAVPELACGGAEIGRPREDRLLLHPSVRPVLAHHGPVAHRAVRVLHFPELRRNARGPRPGVEEDLLRAVREGHPRPLLVPHLQGDSAGRVPGVVQHVERDEAARVGQSAEVGEGQRPRLVQAHVGGRGEGQLRPSLRGIAIPVRVGRDHAGRPRAVPGHHRRARHHVVPEAVGVLAAVHQPVDDYAPPVRLAQAHPPPRAVVRLARQQVTVQVRQHRARIVARDEALAVSFPVRVRADHLLDRRTRLELRRPVVDPMVRASVLQHLRVYGGGETPVAGAALLRGPGRRHPHARQGNQKGRPAEQGAAPAPLWIQETSGSWGGGGELRSAPHRAPCPLWKRTKNW